MSEMANHCSRREDLQTDDTTKDEGELVRGREKEEAPL